MNDNIKNLVEEYLKQDYNVIEFKEDSLIQFIKQNLDKFKIFYETNINDIPVYDNFDLLNKFQRTIKAELLDKLEVKDLDKYFYFDFSLYDYESLSNAYLKYISGLLENEENNYNLLEISELIKEAHNFIIDIDNNQNFKDFLLNEYSIYKLYKSDDLLIKDYFIQDLIENNFFNEIKPTVNLNM